MQEGPFFVINFSHDFTYMQPKNVFQILLELIELQPPVAPGLKDLPNQRVACLKWPELYLGT